MTDHEPVNIMGVFAFPNPDRDNRMIRFIDSEYNTLFTVKDGERIVLTNLDDQTEILACTYIDDCHTKIGSTTFHIRQFAEIQENYGIRYMPCEPKPEDMVDTYEIYRAVIGNAGGGVRSFEEAKKTLRAKNYSRVYAGMYAKGNSLEHLVEKQLEKNGLSKKELNINKTALAAIIHGYTREAGVRNLERRIAQICRVTAKKKLAGEYEAGKQVKVTAKNLEDFLGKPRFKDDHAEEKAQVGTATGLAWTSVGGDTLTIEVVTMPGKGEMILTGNLGDVMKESARIALSYVRSGGFLWQK